MSATVPLHRPPPAVLDAPVAGTPTPSPHATTANGSEVPRKADTAWAAERLLSVIDIETPAVPDERPLSTRDIALGVTGYVLLPAIALLDVGSAGMMPTAIAPPIAALFLSVPSLVVGHQYLGLHADPRELMADVGRVFVQGGRLALGVVPAVGMYAATTGLGPVALMVSLTVIGLGSVELARRRLLRREAMVPTTDTLDSLDIQDTHSRRIRMTLLATAWAILSLLIAVRLGISLLFAL